MLDRFYGGATMFLPVDCGTSSIGRVVRSRREDVTTSCLTLLNPNRSRISKSRHRIRLDKIIVNLWINNRTMDSLKSPALIQFLGSPFMERRIKIQVINGESQLPETIIQHIQSFLSGKEAARTTVLSKFWNSAWLTRPNLDFDQRYFQRNLCHDRRESLITDDGFSEFANKTLQRYDESNLKIERFRLCIYGRDSKSVANELIVKAMKLGATDLEFVDYHHILCVLPHEVLGSENLVSLSVKGCKIGLGMDGKVRCSRLKSLSLCRMYMEGDIIWDIISSCPLIEKLSLSNCLYKVETFDVFARKKTKILKPSPFSGFGKRNVGSSVDGPIIPYKFHKLKCLVLAGVRIDTLFFRDLSSKFPCLKDLSVDDCFGYNKEIQISSCSLECISFAQNEVLRAKFDVPRIRKFSFSSFFLPVLSFKNSSREWEFDLSIMCLLRPATSCFLRLRKFLAEFSMSKVSLSIWFGPFSEKSYDYGREDIKGLPKPLLENLKVSVFQRSIVRCVHLDALLWSCRPKLITQYWLSKSSPDGELVDLLCKTLVQQVSENCYIPNRNMCGLHDLKEVYVEIFEDSVAEWRPLPWKTLMDTSASPENKREIRFQLKWG